MNRSDWHNTALCAEARSDALWIEALALARVPGQWRPSLELVDRRWREHDTASAAHARAYTLWTAGGD